MSINAAMLLAGVLLLLGIASCKFSARLGVPVRVLFLSVGMLAGSEGLGRIPFNAGCRCSGGIGAAPGTAAERR